MKAGRLSNLELLRVISIFMIIIHHFSIRSYEVCSNDTSSFILLFFQSLGKAGVNCFVIIGSYFLVNSKFKISKILYITLSSLFYYLLFYTILKLIGLNVSINILSIFTDSPYWFAKTYCILLILSPIGNYILNKIRKIKVQIILFIMSTIVVVVLPFISTEYNFASKNRIIAFCYVYFIAAIIKKIETNKNYRNIQLKIGVMFIVASLTITFIYIYLWMNGNEYMNRFMFFSENGITCLCLSIGLFLVFKNINIKFNKYINILASCTLGIYFIHDSRYISPYLWKYVGLINIDGPIMMFIYGIIVSTLVLLLCAFIDLLKQKSIDKYINKISEITNMKINKIKFLTR